MCRRRAPGPHGPEQDLRRWRVECAPCFRRLLSSFSPPHHLSLGAPDGGIDRAAFRPTTLRCAAISVPPPSTSSRRFPLCRCGSGCCSRPTFCNAATAQSARLVALVIPVVIRAQSACGGNQFRLETMFELLQFHRFNTGVPSCLLRRVRRALLLPRHAFCWPRFAWYLAASYRSRRRPPVRPARNANSLSNSVPGLSLAMHPALPRSPRLRALN